MRGSFLNLSLVRNAQDSTRMLQARMPTVRSKLTGRITRERTGQAAIVRAIARSSWPITPQPTHRQLSYGVPNAARGKVVGVALVGNVEQETIIPLSAGQVLSRALLNAEQGRPRIRHGYTDRTVQGHRPQCTQARIVRQQGKMGIPDRRSSRRCHLALPPSLSRETTRDERCLASVRQSRSSSQRTT